MSHRPLAECFAMCPPALGSYASRNLDSIRKITNHVVLVTLVCNVFLFLSSFGVSLLPNVGLNVVMISFLLIVQTVCVGIILNHNMAPTVTFLYPTPMVVGVALGTTIGAAVLALVVSSAYQRVCQAPAPSTNTTTDPNFDNPLLDDICEKHSGSIRAVCFWSGLVAWFNFCTCLLLTVGQHELAGGGSNQYQNIGGAPPPSAAGGAPAFVGDYATIPEIRNQQGSESPAQVQSV